MSFSTTICAVATPPGEGALGVVRLSGPDALALLLRACGADPPRFADRRVRLVALCDPEGGERVDEVLATFMRGPRSYTGEDVVEVSGHGGRLNLQRLLELFISLGAVQAAPGEFTRRAFVNGRIDLVQAEAVAAVIAARSERALRNAQALLSGELGRALGRVRDAVVEIVAGLEASIDFVDEPEVGEPLLERQTTALGEVAAALRRIAGTYERGRLLGGVSVALAGRVNAGKSSLFNALVGSERALVSEEPGTTRDYLEAELSWGGLAVTLVDTAGRRRSGTALERAGRALGEARVRRSDAVVEVVDLAAEAALTRDPDLPAATVVAANKVDLLSGRERDLRLARIAERRGPGVRVVACSAVRGDGLEALRRGVVAALDGEGGEHGEGGEALAGAQETVQLTSARHHEALLRAAVALEAAIDATGHGAPPEVLVEHPRAALAALGEVTGEGASTEEVLDAIFARFCIGK